MFSIIWPYYVLKVIYEMSPQQSKLNKIHYMTNVLEEDNGPPPSHPLSVPPQKVDKHVASELDE